MAEVARSAALRSQESREEGMPLSLSTLAKGRWRVSLEESWKAEKPEIRKPDRRWYEEICCRKGSFIYLFSDSPATLALFLNNRPHIGKQILQEIPGSRLHLKMDKEVLIHFPPEALYRVCELVGGRKKKQYSEETRQKMVEQGRALAQMRQKSL